MTASLANRARARGVRLFLRVDFEAAGPVDPDLVAELERDAGRLLDELALERVARMLRAIEDAPARLALADLARAEAALAGVVETSPEGELVEACGTVTER